MHTKSWQHIQQDNITCLHKLADLLKLDPKNKKQLLDESPFSFNLPLRLAKKIKKNCLDDPLFLQFVPIKKEQIIQPGFSKDPVLDTDFLKKKKLLHKYKNRALLLISSACAMHCRYCFRRFFPYEKAYTPFTEELEYIKQHTEIDEVILSGGDPLSMADPLLEKLLRQLCLIPHIKKIRFHTRFVIGIPERITDKLLQLIESLPVQVYFVIHVNHPNELSEDLFIKLKKVHKTGALVLSQTVLLKNINDNHKTLVSLFSLLSERGILPYYLHQFDPVQGAAHFAVSEEKGKKLMQEIRTDLSGYSIPFYVKEIPHKTSKTVI